MKSDDSIPRLRSPRELANQFEGLKALRECLDIHLDKWFITGGALLGARREGDFIQWDWDVEVSVLTEEILNKRVSFIADLSRKGFDIRAFDESPSKFKIVCYRDESKFEILGRVLCQRGKYRCRPNLKVPAHFFNESQLVSLRGERFPAPSPVDDFLTAVYGDWRNPVRSSDKARYFSSRAYRANSLAFTRLLATIGKIRSLVTPALFEFPKFQKNIVSKFSSWDPEIGWVNPPNSVRIDRSDRKVSKSKPGRSLAIFSTDHLGSRSSPIPLGETEVLIVGDSYAMCREVQDDETFAWYLSESIGKRVSNYGVGNYGIDQALMLLERVLPQDPPKRVVLSVTTVTMARASSVFRHYLENGNFLAIKPRYLVDLGARDLVKIPLPFRTRDDLKKLSRAKRHFRSYDEHYSRWKEKRALYIRRDFWRRLARRWDPVENAREDFLYQISFWRQEKELFILLIEKFHQLSIKFDFQAVFLLQHQQLSLDYLADCDTQPPWKPAIDEARKLFPSIKFLDEAALLLNGQPDNQLFTGSHHSPLANRLIAGWLKRELFH